MVTIDKQDLGVNKRKHRRYKEQRISQIEILEHLHWNVSLNLVVTWLKIDTQYYKTNERALFPPCQ